MLKGMVRPSSVLNGVGCPACSSSRAGAPSARTFSTQSFKTNTNLTSAPHPPVTHSAFAVSKNGLARRQLSNYPVVRAFGSTSLRPAEDQHDQSAEDLAERLAAEELDEMEQMMKQFEEQQLTPEPVARATIDDATEFGSSWSSTYTPHPAVPISPPEAPAPINPFALLRPSFPAGPPTISDLNSLRPKQFARPDASSPESLRILYAKSWTAGLAKLTTAFKKSQLIKLVTLSTEQGGLELKHDDLRLKTGIKINKRAKYWKPKKFEIMSKRELTQSIMVLEWGMVDPETLPKAKVGPTQVETMPLSDRSLFLLLSPNSTTLVNLSRTYGVKASFTRDPETQALMLSLRGTKASVQQAKEEITGLPELSPQQEFELPRPATTLRPELFQAVSRLSKTFLEPGSEPNALAATAINKDSIDRAERLLNTAFTSDALQTSHRTFASLPTSLDSLDYSMVPFVPANAAPWTAGAATSFARVQAVSLAPMPASEAEGEENDRRASHAAALEFQSWAVKMKLDKTSRVPLSQDGPSNALPALSSPFLKEMKDGDRLEMKASFGHLVWPVYPPTAQPSASSEVSILGLGPVLEGTWTFDKFAKWRNEIGTATKSAFLGCPPPGHLASTAIMTPQQTANPFSVLMNDLNMDETEAQLDTLPRIDSEEFRQLVYRPLSLPVAGEANERIEVEYEADADVIRRSRIKESRLNVMVPNGATDFQVTLSHTAEVAPHAVPELPSATASAPLLIHHNSTPFLLASDRHVRRTFILPPRTPAVPLASGDVAPLPRVQERWTDNLMEEGRGAEVSLLIGEGSGDNFWAGRWKDGIRECEGVAMRGKRAGKEAKVFSSRR